MAAKTYTYDPQKVTITWGGVPVVEFSEGEFVKIAFDEQDFTKKRGLNSVTRTQIGIRTANITLMLSHSSASNRRFSLLHEADRLSGASALPFVVRDGNGQTLFFAASAWIQKLPEMSESATEAVDREWIFDTGECDLVIGGDAEANA